MQRCPLGILEDAVINSIPFPWQLASGFKIYTFSGPSPYNKRYLCTFLGLGYLSAEGELLGRERPGVGVEIEFLGKLFEEFVKVPAEQVLPVEVYHAREVVYHLVDLKRLELPHVDTLDGLLICLRCPPRGCPSRCPGKI